MKTAACQNLPVLVTRASIVQAVRTLADQQSMNAHLVTTVKYRAHRNKAAHQGLIRMNGDRWVLFVKHLYVEQYHGSLFIP